MNAIEADDAVVLPLWMKTTAVPAVTARRITLPVVELRNILAIRHVGEMSTKCGGYASSQCIDYGEQIAKLNEHSRTLLFLTNMISYITCCKQEGELICIYLLRKKKV